MSDELDDVLADPARLLTADRAEIRHRVAAAEGAESVGREVFLQAEAIFGEADVPPAEFASWLHFAAKATGHEEYAERVTAAEPGMPWRTVWAWWRPANRFPAHPSLNGDYFQVLRRLHKGREIVEVTDGLRGPVRLDAETGRRVTVGDEEALTEAPDQLPEAVELHVWDLTAPASWQGAAPFAAEGGRVRHLVEDTHGIAVLETDAEVLRHWPRDRGTDTTSAEEPPSGAVPARRRPTGPLDAARVDEAFGERNVRRLPEEELPEGLEHAGSRRHLRDVGVPAYWVCHGIEFEAHAAEATRPPAEDALPGCDVAADLLALGVCELGELYLHRHDGSVHVWCRPFGATGQELVLLAPDLDVFTRVLEAVYRYRNACWHPYPAEGDQDEVAREFLDEMEELAPGLFDPETPSGHAWSWFHAGITELGVDGF